MDLDELLDEIRIRFNVQVTSYGGELDYRIHVSKRELGGVEACLERRVGEWYVRRPNGIEGESFTHLDEAVDHLQTLLGPPLGKTLPGQLRYTRFNGGFTRTVPAYGLTKLQEEQMVDIAKLRQEHEQVTARLEYLTVKLERRVLNCSHGIFIETSTPMTLLSVRRDCLVCGAVIDFVERTDGKT